MTEALLLVNGQAVLVRRDHIGHNDGITTTNGINGIIANAQSNNNNTVFHGNIVYSGSNNNNNNNIASSTNASMNNETNPTPTVQRLTLKKSSSLLDQLSHATINNVTTAQSFKQEKNIPLISQASALSEFLQIHDNSCIKTSNSINGGLLQLQSNYDQNQAYSVAPNGNLSISSDKDMDDMDITEESQLNNNLGRLPGVISIPFASNIHSSPGTEQSRNINDDKTMSSSVNNCSTVFAILQTEDGLTQTVRLTHEEAEQLGVDISHLKPKVCNESSPRIVSNNFSKNNNHIKDLNKNIPTTINRHSHSSNIENRNVSQVLNSNNINVHLQNPKITSSDPCILMPGFNNRNGSVMEVKNVVGNMTINSLPISTEKQIETSPKVTKITHMDRAIKKPNSYSSLLFTEESVASTTIKPTDTTKSLRVNTMKDDADSEDIEVDVCSTDHSPPLFGQKSQYDWSPIPLKIQAKPKPRKNSSNKNKVTKLKKLNPSLTPLKNNKKNSKISTVILEKGMKPSNPVKTVLPIVTYAIPNVKAKLEASVIAAKSQENFTTSHENISKNFGSIGLERSSKGVPEEPLTIRINTGKGNPQRGSSSCSLIKKNNNETSLFETPAVSVCKPEVKSFPKNTDLDDVPSIVYSSATEGDPYAVPVPGGDSTKPLGSSENPIQLVQRGCTFKALQPVQEKHLEQITSLLQQRKGLHNKESKDEVYDRNSNIKIVYKVFYPEMSNTANPYDDFEEADDDDDEDVDIEVSVVDASKAEEKAKRGRPRIVPCSKDNLKESLIPDKNGIINMFNLNEENNTNSTVPLPPPPVMSRTRSGRISRPPKHMVKDYKYLIQVENNVNEHHEQQLCTNYNVTQIIDDSNGESKEQNISDFACPTKRRKSGISTTARLRYTCVTCGKLYIGTRMEDHYAKFPDHRHGTGGNGNGISPSFILQSFSALRAVSVPSTSSSLSSSSSLASSSSTTTTTPSTSVSATTSNITDNTETIQENNKNAASPTPGTQASEASSSEPSMPMETKTSQQDGFNGDQNERIILPNVRLCEVPTINNNIDTKNVSNNIINKDILDDQPAVTTIRRGRGRGRGKDRGRGRGRGSGHSGSSSSKTFNDPPPPSLEILEKVLLNYSTNDILKTLGKIIKDTVTPWELLCVQAQSLCANNNNNNNNNGCSSIPSHLQDALSLLQKLLQDCRAEVTGNMQPVIDPDQNTFNLPLGKPGSSSPVKSEDSNGFSSIIDSWRDQPLQRNSIHDGEQEHSPTLNSFSTMEKSEEVLKISEELSVALGVSSGVYRWKESIQSDAKKDNCVNQNHHEQVSHNIDIHCDLKAENIINEANIRPSTVLKSLKAEPLSPVHNNNNKSNNLINSTPLFTMDTLNNGHHIPSTIQNSVVDSIVNVEDSIDQSHSYKKIKMDSTSSSCINKSSTSSLLDDNNLFSIGSLNVNGIQSTNNVQKNNSRQVSLDSISNNHSHISGTTIKMDSSRTSRCKEPDTILDNSHLFSIDSLDGHNPTTIEKPSSVIEKSPSRSIQTPTNADLLPSASKKQKLDSISPLYNKSVSSIIDNSHLFSTESLDSFKGVSDAAINYNIVASCLASSCISLKNPVNHVSAVKNLSYQLDSEDAVNFTKLPNLSSNGIKMVDTINTQLLSNTGSVSFNSIRKTSSTTPKFKASFVPVVTTASVTNSLECITTNTILPDPLSPYTSEVDVSALNIPSDSCMYTPIKSTTCSKTYNESIAPFSPTFSSTMTNFKPSFCSTSSTTPSTFLTNASNHTSLLSSLNQTTASHFISPTTASHFISPTTASHFISPTTASHFISPTTASHFSSPTTASHFSSPTTASHFISPTTASHFSSPTTASHFISPITSSYTPAIIASPLNSSITSSPLKSIFTSYPHTVSQSTVPRSLTFTQHSTTGCSLPSPVTHSSTSFTLPEKASEFTGIFTGSDTMITCTPGCVTSVCSSPSIRQSNLTTIKSSLSAPSSEFLPTFSATSFTPTFSTSFGTNVSIPPPSPSISPSFSIPFASTAFPNLTNPLVAFTTSLGPTFTTTAEFGLTVPSPSVSPAICTPTLSPPISTRSVSPILTSSCDATFTTFVPALSPIFSTSFTSIISSPSPPLSTVFSAASTSTSFSSPLFSKSIFSNIFTSSFSSLTTSTSTTSSPFLTYAPSNPVTTLHNSISKSSLDSTTDHSFKQPLFTSVYSSSTMTPIITVSTPSFSPLDSMTFSTGSTNVASSSFSSLFSTSNVNPLGTAEMNGNSLVTGEMNGGNHQNGLSSSAISSLQRCIDLPTLENVLTSTTSNLVQDTTSISQMSLADLDITADDLPRLLNEGTGQNSNDGPKLLEASNDTSDLGDILLKLQEASGRLTPEHGSSTDLFREQILAATAHLSSHVSHSNNLQQTTQNLCAPTSQLCCDVPQGLMSLSQEYSLGHVTAHHKKQRSSNNSSNTLITTFTDALASSQLGHVNHDSALLTSSENPDVNMSTELDKNVIKYYK